MDNKQALNKILEAFKIKATCVDYLKVRNISLYDLFMTPGTKVRELQGFSNEISLSLKSKSKPIVKIIPELGIVRLEVTDEDPCKISFFEEFNKIEHQKGGLPMYLGSTVNGKDLWIDMVKNPHLLIAGTTGSGKSTLLHLIMANSVSLPNVKVCLIDSKNIEFKDYENFKNVTIANDYKSANNLLSFLYQEMEYRYSMMSERRLSSEYFYSSHEEFPHILFIIDEFADIIMQDEDKSFYTKLCKLAQKSRAAGIHCVLATQRPSVDILKGSIKANFPARISCQVASNVDSRVILDSPGAELLAGRGDAIIKNYNNNYQRFQVAYVEPGEVCKFHAKKENSIQY